MLDAYLIIKVPFFSYSVKKRYNKLTQPKYYSADNGFLQITSLHFTKDYGKQFENAVLLEIARSHQDIAYWSNKGEVDFVFSKRAINVTVAEKIPKREFEGLIEFSKKHRNFDMDIVIKDNVKTDEEIRAIDIVELTKTLE